MHHVQHEFASPDWSSENHRGVALAAEGAWIEAAHAFDRAAASLERATGTDLAAHDALALVLGNLSQSLFQAGHVDEAIPHAQRACALRAAIAGDDAIAVARVRSDLAVMLAASGRLQEAPALLERARIAIEHSAGDEDPRLVTVLENIARVALAAGDVASAEPTLLRLHALLDANGMGTARADALLAHVGDIRRARASTPPSSAIVPPVLFLTPPAFTPVASTTVASTPVASTPVASTPVTSTPVTSTPVTSAPVASVAIDHASPAESEGDEPDDQPLLDAVRVTDVLLRTTPTGVPVVRSEPDATEPWTSAPAPSETTPDALDASYTEEIAAASETEAAADPIVAAEVIDDLTDERPEERAEERPEELLDAASADEIELVDATPIPNSDATIESQDHPDRVAADSAADTVATDTVAADTVAADSAADIVADLDDTLDDNLLTTSEFEVHQQAPAGGTTSALGFEVQYGIPMDDEPPPPRRTPDVFGGIELVEETLPMVPAAPAPIPSEPVASQSPQFSPGTDSRSGNTEARPVAVVMPAAAGSQSGARPAQGGDDAADDARLRVQRIDGSDERGTRRAPRIAGAGDSGNGGKGKGAVIGGAIGLALAAAAAWFFTRGGM